MTNQRPVKRNSNLNYKFRGCFSPIGIDIGSAQIKIVQLQKTSGRIALHCLANVSTPSGSISKGEIIDPEKLSTKLASIGSKLDLHGRQVNLCLGTGAYFSRLIKLPPLSQKELRKIVPWELEKHFPLTPAESVYDCCPSTFYPAKKTLLNSYLLAAAKKETADHLLGAIEQAGFKPLSLEVTSLALLRSQHHLFEAQAKQKAKTTLILDIGFHCSTLLLVHNQGLHYHRLLKIGVADFINEAAGAADLNPGGVQQGLFNKRSANAISGTATAAALADQIGKSMAYWHDQSGLHNVEPEALILCGGGASLSGLAAYLAESLELEPKMFRFAGPGSRDSENGGYDRQENLPLFATAYGLALRGWLR